jgi:cytochrome o ubiquinol oxidase operon protein cyoD
MSGQTHTTEEQADLKREEQQDFHSYVWGISLALLLTVVPFALVRWAPGIPRFSLLIVIGAFALVQMLLHFRCFLHIGFKQKREDLQLILFSALLLTIMVAGTIWIMASLATRMAMPGLPQTQAQAIVQPAAFRHTWEERSTAALVSRSNGGGTNDGRPDQSYGVLLEP